RVLLIDFSRVDTIDSAGVEGLSMLVQRFVQNGRQAIFAGVRLDDESRLYLESSCASANFIVDLDSAIEACEESMLTGVPVSERNGSNGHDESSFDRLDIVDNLNSDEEAYLKTKLERHQYNAGHCICRKGEAADRIFFLSRGQVSVRLYNGSSS